MQKTIWQRIAAAILLTLFSVPIAFGAVYQGVLTAAETASVQETPTETTTAAPETTTEPPATLAVTSPEQTELAVDEPFVNLRGTCAVHLPLTINDVPVTVAADGTFSYDCPLVPGENTVTVTNTDLTFTYTVTYDLQVIRAVSPAKSVTMNGGMKLELTAEALEGATVTAKLNGQTVRLSPVADSDDGTGFVEYNGEFTAPAAQYSAQKLGKVRFTGTIDGYSQTVSGASVTVNKIEYPEIEIDEGAGTVKPPVISGDGYVEVLSPTQDYGNGSARVLRVTADYAETCPGDTADDKSDPRCTPFLKGMYDYVVGTGTFDGKDYYITRSGYKVETAQSESFDGYVLPANTISVHKCYTDDETNLILTMNWKAPFISELKEQSYYKGYAGRVFNVTDSTAQYIDFKFYYTNAAEGPFDFSGSNVISRAEWVNVGQNGTTTLRVYLKSRGDFYGYRAYYSSDNRLVISFQNRPSSVSDAVIALDPGHGGRDPGVIGVNKMYESEVNLRISALVKQKLEAAGVDVVIFRTGNQTIELEERQAKARAAGANAFVCLHNNSSTSGSVSGTEVYYYRAFSQPLAASIHAQLVTAWRGIYANNSAMLNKVVPNDGGVRFYPFKVTRIEECPAVLVECGYLSNATECGALALPQNQEKLAEAVSNGIIRYLQANCA